MLEQGLSVHMSVGTLVMMLSVITVVNCPSDLMMVSDSGSIDLSIDSLLQRSSLSGLWLSSSQSSGVSSPCSSGDSSERTHFSEFGSQDLLVPDTSLSDVSSSSLNESLADVSVTLDGVESLSVEYASRSTVSSSLVDGESRTECSWVINQHLGTKEFLSGLGLLDTSFSWVHDLVSDTSPFSSSDTEVSAVLNSVDINSANTNSSASSDGPLDTFQCSVGMLVRNTFEFLDQSAESSFSPLSANSSNLLDPFGFVQFDPSWSVSESIGAFHELLVDLSHVG